MVAITKTYSFKKNRSKGNNLDSLIQTLSKLDVSNKQDEAMDVCDEGHNVIHINACFKTDLMYAVLNNDISKASQLLRDEAREGYLIAEVDTYFFHMIGKYCQGILYSILRNSNLFEDKFSDPFYFDAIIEGIAKTDNCELLRHMTNTHQLALITEHKLGTYLQCLIESRAYKCLECLTRFLSHMNSQDSQTVLKEVFARGIETLDNRVVTTILKSMKPIIKT